MPRQHIIGIVALVVGVLVLLNGFRKDFWWARPGGGVGPPMPRWLGVLFSLAAGAFLLWFGITELKAP